MRIDNGSPQPFPSHTDGNAPRQDTAKGAPQAGPTVPAGVDAKRVLTVAAEEITLAHSERAELQKRLNRENKPAPGADAHGTKPVVPT